MQRKCEQCGLLDGSGRLIFFQRGEELICEGCKAEREEAPKKIREKAERAADEAFERFKP